MSEKKVVRIMGIMVFKSSGLDTQFQRKNQFRKICTESQDITKKVSKICHPNQTSKICHILANISGLDAYFSKQIFALKLWVQAARFEYPIIQTIFIIQSLNNYFANKGPQKMAFFAVFLDIL